MDGSACKAYLRNNNVRDCECKIFPILMEDQLVFKRDSFVKHRLYAVSLLGSSKAILQPFLCIRLLLCVALHSMFKETTKDEIRGRKS